MSSGGQDSGTDGGLHQLPLLGGHVTDLSEGRRGLVLVLSGGQSVIIRSSEREDGSRETDKPMFVKHHERILAVTCSDDTTILLTESGLLLSLDRLCSVPRALKVLRSRPVSQVACGSHHTVALTKDGRVFTWGQNSRGQLGLSKKRLSCRSPQHVGCLSAAPLVQIAAGGEQSFALSVSGGVLGWGRNDCGQLGLGDGTDRATPTVLDCLNLKKTIHVSCGKDHTVALTKAGTVLTFGSGRYGQLGHNSLRNELRPRLVTELWGAKVTRIACGWYHTLVSTESQRVYSFGRGEQGQLGRGEEGCPSVPLPVQLPPGGAVDPKIRNIFARGNSSFVTCASREEVLEEPDDVGVSGGTQDCLEGLIDRWTSECDSDSWETIKQEIHRTFSSASCINRSFLERSKDKHFQTSPKYSGLNLSLSRISFEKLVREEGVLTEVEAAILDLLPSLSEEPVGVEGLRIYLLLNELLFVIQRLKGGRRSTPLAVGVAAALLRLSPRSLRVIGFWWASLSPCTLVKHVKVWKRAVSVILCTNPLPQYSGVQNLLLVLQHMYNVNSGIAEHRRIPEKDFHLTMNNDFLAQDLKLWKSRIFQLGEDFEPIILCSFPALMDLQSKKMVFDMDATFTKNEMVGMTLLVNYFMMVEPPTPEEMMFVLYLRRTSVLEDTFLQLTETDFFALKMPLLVFFDENHEVNDVYRKDFFYEVFHEMVSAESEMFMFNDSETLAWFPSKATKDNRRFFLFGVLCGLALYNRCIVHLPFPLALFKKLLDVKPSLEDLIEFSPCVGASLKYILEDCNDEDIESMVMHFTVTWDGVEAELDPGNPGAPVTSQNKKTFVDAYVNHVFNTSVEDVFQMFKQGFFEICDEELVKLFRPKELQEVLVGKDICDWTKLKENTGYEGDLHRSHPTVQMFWEVFDGLTEDQKRAFLWFVTGFERQPINGMGEIKMFIRVHSVEEVQWDQFYPETHTCYSLLQLPLYSTKEIMQTKLTEALSSNRMNHK